jgi:O-antigen biosynthesis protein
MNGPLVITGMHRSGTSLAAAVLQSAGLHIGDCLLGPRHGNLAGHFEDLDFVGFHQDVLAAAGESTEGWTLRSDVMISSEHAVFAKALVEGKASHGVLWGWKDPRTTLFLSFWARLLPNAAFLLLFRPPWAVIDSLYRRGDFEFLWKPARAVELWIHYNRLMLDFVEANSQRCLLISIDGLLDDTQLCVGAVRERFQFAFGEPNLALVQPSMLRRQAPDPMLVRAVVSRCPAALAIYKQLLASQPNWLKSAPPEIAAPNMSAADAEAVLESVMAKGREEFVASLSRLEA